MKEERTAVVTGSSGAIGGSVAHALCEHGWQVIGVDLRPGPVGSTRWEEVPGDVASPETWRRVEAILGTRGDRLHGLVHAAAIQVCAPIVETSEEDWDRVMAVNVKSVFQSARLLKPWLSRATGSMVLIGSVHAIATSRNIAAYAASKGALSALARALAVEWAADGIRVNSLFPGAVDSAMLRSGLARGHLEGDATVERQLQELASRSPLGRIGRPEEIAGMVRALLDPSIGSFVTGASIVVDGGVLARLSSE